VIEEAEEAEAVVIEAGVEEAEEVQDQTPLEEVVEKLLSKELMKMETQ
jgi:hypothetical protein